MAGVGGRVNIPVDDLERNGLGDPSGKGGGTSIVRSLGGEDSSCGVLEARSIDCRGGNAADKAVTRQSGETHRQRCHRSGPDRSSSRGWLANDPAHPMSTVCMHTRVRERKSACPTLKKAIKSS